MTLVTIAPSVLTQMIRAKMFATEPSVGAKVSLQHLRARPIYCGPHQYYHMGGLVVKQMHGQITLSDEATLNAHQQGVWVQTRVDATTLAQMREDGVVLDGTIDFGEGLHYLQLNLTMTGPGRENVRNFLRNDVAYATISTKTSFRLELVK